ncbi:transposase family protein [Myceligenerans indicum]|uniref:transposase family protein n=1 Tax=Myceligenerans indicum TaxID=2593663 RepID=UPI0035564043
MCLPGGHLIETTKTAAPGQRAADLWWSGKHDRRGGNIQVLTGPDGYPEWVSPVAPGSTHDITAARTHVLPPLYPAAAAGLPADTGPVAGMTLLTMRRRVRPRHNCSNGWCALVSPRVSRWKRICVASCAGEFNGECSQAGEDSIVPCSCGRARSLAWRQAAHARLRPTQARWRSATKLSWRRRPRRMPTLVRPSMSWSPCAPGPSSTRVQDQRPALPGAMDVPHLRHTHVLTTSPNSDPVLRVSREVLDHIAIGRSSRHLHQEI